MMPFQSGSEGNRFRLFGRNAAFRVDADGNSKGDPTMKRSGLFWSMLASGLVISSLVFASTPSLASSVTLSFLREPQAGVVNKTITATAFDSSSTAPTLAVQITNGSQTASI